MTGNDFIARSLVDLGESQSTSAQQQSMRYPDHARDTANEIAEETFSIYRTAVIDIVDGQLDYEFPLKPFRTDSLSITYPNGRVLPLDSITVAEADREFPGWRSTGINQFVTSRRFYISEGANNYKIIPAPGYNWPDGLMVTGYYGVSKWWDMGDECPLQNGSNRCMQVGIELKRCLEMRRQDPTYAQLIPELQKEYNTTKSRLYMNAINSNAARREGIVPGSRKTNFGCGWGWIE